MIREYFVVARYVASVPNGVDETEFILKEVTREISDTSPNKMDSFVRNLFSVLPGEEIDDFEEDEEE